MKKKPEFTALLESFFTDRLMHQRQASSNTIASYRDTFSLLLKFAKENLKKEPSKLSIEDLNASFIVSFLNNREQVHGNSARTRNTRLAAIHSFFRYLAFNTPQYSDLIQRVLAIPSKRYTKKSVEFLTRNEVDAILVEPDQRHWSGRRDRAIILLAAQTGLRVSELIGLQCQDIVLGNGAHVRCKGKGRKERCTPLHKESAMIMRSWLRERDCEPSEPLFVNARGKALSRDGIEYILAKHVKAAKDKCASLKRKRISPHVLRHTAAMNLLQHGVDQFVIALWLGHESVDTTQIYIHADLKMKERILENISLFGIKGSRYQPDDQLLDFLKSL
jgi:site-specific recombinase XerD